MPNYTLTLELDPLGSNPDNYITENAILDSTMAVKLFFPQYIAYHTASLELYLSNDSGTIALQRGVHWQPTELLHKVTLSLGKEIHTAFLITDNTLNGDLEINYQALGGEQYASATIVNEARAHFTAPLAVDWANLSHPQEFQPSSHKQDIRDLYGAEYLVDAINRVTTATALDDQAKGKEVLAYYLEKQKSAFNAALGTQPMQIADIVQSQSQYADSTDLVTFRNQTNLSTQLDILQNNFDSINKQLLFYMRDSYAAKKAFVLKTLVDKQVDYDLSYFPVALHLSGLSCWLDFSDKVNNGEQPSQGVTVIDKSKNHRVFTGGLMSTKKSPRIQQTACIFQGDKRLLLTSGPTVKLMPQHTVLLVTVNDLTGSTGERLTVLSDGGSESLSMDISSGTQLKLNSAYGNYRIAASRLDNARTHFVAACIDPRLEMSYALSTTPQSNQAGDQSFTEAARPLSRVMEYNTLGGLNQNGAIAEIMIFDRLLSRYEIDALNAYFFRKYSVEFNVIANGNFSDGLTDFSTDYTPSILAKTAGSICVMQRQAALSDRSIFSDFYAIPNYLEFQKNMQPDNCFLVVNTSPVITKAFYRVSPILQKDTSYRLSLRLLYNPASPPSVQVKLNGTVLTVFTLDLSRSKADNLEVWFKTTQDTNVIELFNLHTGGPINTFVVDNVTLRRDVQALQSTFTLLNSLE